LSVALQAAGCRRGTARDRAVATCLKPSTGLESLKRVAHGRVEVPLNVARPACTANQDSCQQRTILSSLKWHMIGCCGPKQNASCSFQSHALPIVCAGKEATA